MGFPMRPIYIETVSSYLHLQIFWSTPAAKQDAFSPSPLLFCFACRRPSSCLPTGRRMGKHNKAAEAVYFLLYFPYYQQLLITPPDVTSEGILPYRVRTFLSDSKSERPLGPTFKRTSLLQLLFFFSSRLRG